MKSSSNFNGWKITQLGNICDISSSKRIFASEYKTSGIPFYRGKEIIEKFNKKPISTELFISPERFNEINNKFGVPKEGDILLTSVGTLGIPYLVGNEDFYFKDGNLTWFKQFKSCNSRFLFFWFQSPFAKHQIETKSIGSTQKALTIDILKSFTIHLPPIKVQNKIVAILSSIDDKIELNNKINRNLEAQAQAIFKSWFVDFEPFGGKMPKDWAKINLSDIADFVGGYSYKSNELQHSSDAMATIKNFDRNGGFKLDGFKEIIPSSKLKDIQKVDLFDTLVAHTDLTQNADVIGNAEMLLSKARYSNIIISMDVVKVIPKNGLSKFLLAALLKDARFKKHCLCYVNGTTGLHLSKKALPEYIFAFPNNVENVCDITNLLEGIYRKMARNIEENTRLSELRDTLLPKLMSGEIDISNIAV